MSAVKRIKALLKSAADRLEILNAKALDGGKTVLSERNAAP
jgi:hypothetical protein